MLAPHRHAIQCWLVECMAAAHLRLCSLTPNVNPPHPRAGKLKTGTGPGGPGRTVFSTGLLLFVPVSENGGHMWIVKGPLEIEP
jgi:hypothetical protein